MEFAQEKTSRTLLRIGVIIKAVISFGEIVFGLAFSFLSPEVINGIVPAFVGDELQEANKDFFWKFVAHAFKNFSNTPQSVWAFIFLSHGIVKLFFVSGLWQGKLWAYPASALIFTGFVLYQLYELSIVSSLFLWLITLFDVALIILILHEYKHRKKRMGV